MERFTNFQYFSMAGEEHSQYSMTGEEHFHSSDMATGHELAISGASLSTSMRPGYMPSGYASAGAFITAEGTASSSSWPQSSPGPEETSPQQHWHAPVLTPSASQLSTYPSSPGEGRPDQYQAENGLRDRALSDGDMSNAGYGLRHSTGKPSVGIRFARPV